MGAEEELFSRLSNFAGLTALVGTRVYPITAPQGGTLPCVVFQRISGNRVSAMGADREDKRCRFQFDCYASTPDDTRAVAEQVDAALRRYHGGNIVDVFFSNENDFYDDAPILYRRQTDYIVHYVGA
jgi:Protein of unknown function (DUF3168)